jgi:hypothetical protein
MDYDIITLIFIALSILIFIFMFAWFKWIYKKNTNTVTQQPQQVLPSNLLSNLGSKCTKCVNPPTQGNLKNKLPSGGLPKNNSLQASKMIPVNNKCSTGNCNFKQTAQNNQRTPQFNNQFAIPPVTNSFQMTKTPQTTNFNIVPTQRLNNQNNVTDVVTMNTSKSMTNNNNNKNSNINLDEIYNLNFGNNMDNNNDNDNEWDETENEDNNNDSILNDSDSEINDQDDNYDNDSDCSGDDDDSDVIFQNYF